LTFTSWGQAVAVALERDKQPRPHALVAVEVRLEDCFISESGLTASIQPSLSWLVLAVLVVLFAPRTIHLEQMDLLEQTQVSRHTRHQAVISV
jgi:hypothetical protein